MNMNMDPAMMACYLVEAEYIRSQGGEPNWDPQVNSSLFPMEWASISDYQWRARVLKEAIETGNLIINTSKYQERIEGVRDIIK